MREFPDGEGDNAAKALEVESSGVLGTEKQL